ncbi:hypothetical protein PENTCL1PPCAC_7718 [Pristionchus entomophagus]|uniref:glucuronosyltransferase n=1 Tax=Pristionchus entomophagus TaxID=358040 RepID=A0AAV5SZL9_9BILA|nr:hypothetical protein PENTCL1PPCAC_7718 [Pristionchus entomophagus]
MLVDAGHEMVMLSVGFDSSVGGPGTKRSRVIEIPQLAKFRDVQKFLNGEGSVNFWEDTAVHQSLQGWCDMQVLYSEQCRDEVLQPELLERLKSEKFDAAYVESYSHMSYVLFHLLDINKFAITDSVAINDGWFYYTQSPSNPAYVPTEMGAIAMEKMNFVERLYNTYVYSLVAYFYVRNSVTFQSTIQEKFPDLPPFRDLLGDNSLVFVNSEPLVDFPRPSSSRIIDIGGIVVSSIHEPLNNTWSNIMDLRPNTVFLSFGTFAKAYLIPEQYKRTIVENVKKFPNVTFIWKYERPEHNIFLREWII